MGNDSVIYIRTDGNSNIATGHLVRCLCIAQALENLGKTVCFLVSDKDSKTLLEDLAESIFPDYSSYSTKLLETAVYDNLELEIDEMVEFLGSSHNDFKSNTLPNTSISDESEKNIPTVLIDSYFVTKDYLFSLRKIAKIAYMDDLRAFDYDVDMVINYDVIPKSKEEEYRQAYTNADITLLGAQYTPLRNQFQNQKVVMREKIRNVLITTGGSDPYHFTESLVFSLLTQNIDVNLHVVVGRLFKNTTALKSLVGKYPQVHLYHNVNNMAELMKQCDFAVSAAGTTLYELCALGIPAISFTMADNQIIMAETFKETQAVPYAGDIRDAGNFNVAECISNHLYFLMKDTDMRKVQQEKMRSLVDGNGAAKIAIELCRL